MNVDLSQFDNLELDNVAEWPPLAKLVLTIFLAIVTMGLGYVVLISDKIDLLNSAAIEETTLKQTYEAKYHVAANLELFQAQMVEAEALFAKQIKSLPESHEIPGLLDDITFVGTTSGLSFVKLNWQPEIIQEIYIELPIDIEVIGKYHDFGSFVSKIAGLPRIVTLHDFEINLSKETNEQLKLKLQAKTYRYREAEDK
ncbi:MAG: type IV pilus assembly protein PilO [Alteromonadaceae bacterium]|jgi:type IV pilus assembly protein PilO